MNDLDDTLATCLDDMLAGRATVDDCLRRYPDRAEELRPLLTTAQAVQTAPSVEPRASFSLAAPQRMQSMIAARQAEAHKGWRWPRVSWLRAAALAMLVLSLTLGGTAYAARDSQADSVLYPVKTTVDRMKVAAAPNKQKQGKLLRQTIDARAREVVVAARKGSAKETLRSAREYALVARDLESVAAKLPPGKNETREVLVGLRSNLAEHQTQFQRLRNEAPLAARPGILQALQACVHAIQIITGRLQEALHVMPHTL